MTTKGMMIALFVGLAGCGGYEHPMSFPPPSGVDTPETPEQLCIRTLFNTIHGALITRRESIVCDGQSGKLFLTRYTTADAVYVIKDGSSPYWVGGNQTDCIKQIATRPFPPGPEYACSYVTY